MRSRIWNKYNQKCAYCGKNIALKDMQIDHINPKALGGKDKEENYNPACRRCNKWKATYSLEQFKEEIQKQVERLRRDVAGFRLAEDFSMIKDCTHKPQFYFES